MCCTFNTHSSEQRSRGWRSAEIHLCCALGNYPFKWHCVFSPSKAHKTAVFKANIWAGFYYYYYFNSILACWFFIYLLSEICTHNPWPNFPPKSSLNSSNALQGLPLKLPWRVCALSVLRIKKNGKRKEERNRRQEKAEQGSSTHRRGKKSISQWREKRRSLQLPSWKPCSIPQKGAWPGKKQMPIRTTF